MKRQRYNNWYSTTFTL